MNNNREFINSFNNIEDYFKRQLNISNNLAFHQLLTRVSKQNKVVDHYKAELNTLRELRNFVVHGSIEEPLVIVSDITVQRIKQIEEAFIVPKKIREVFLEKVVAVSEADSLQEVLKIIKKTNYSQFPVLDENGFKGLITDNGITHWLANNIHEDFISIKDTCICDVMIDDEEVDSYTYLYNYDNLYDVIKAFDKGRSTHKRSFVIIVLKRKTDNVSLDDIYTILTPWDLNAVYKNLGLKNQ